MSLTYLATPYSHDEPSVRENRFRVVNQVAARLIADGKHVYSPISHSHPIVMEGDLRTDWKFWADHDRMILEVCERLIVVKQPGWQTSVGVAEEIAIADELNIPIDFVDP